MSEAKTLPGNLVAAIRYFADAQNCHDFLVSMRWPKGAKCPHCGSESVGTFSGKRRVSNCKNKECRKQFTAKLGSIFEDSPLGLDKWLPAVWMIVNSKNGVSSCEMARSLGVTQKTAWHMGHRIRLALQHGTFEKLGGIVEVDESFIGGKARNMHKKRREERGLSGTGAVGKAAVMGLLERHTDKKTSRIIAEVVPNTRKRVLTGKVRQYVVKDSEVHTDALPSYHDLKKDFEHKVVDHAECYVKENVHTNGLENFWSLLKRSLKGTYVSVEPFHLHRYLGEQVYRFNERKDSDLNRFSLAVASMAGKHLSYEKLTGKTQVAAGAATA